TGDLLPPLAAGQPPAAAARTGDPAGRALRPGFRTGALGSARAWGAALDYAAAGRRLEQRRGAAAAPGPAGRKRRPQRLRPRLRALAGPPAPGGAAGERGQARSAGAGLLAGGL